MKLTTFQIPAGIVRQVWRTRADRDAFRKANRLCIQCAIPLQPTDGRKCALHTKADRRYARAYKQRNPAYVERWKQKRPPRAHVNAQRRRRYHANQTDGLCVRCWRDALDDANMCGKHHRQLLAAMRQYRRRKKQRATK